MPRPKGGISAVNAVAGLWSVALTTFIVATLYLGRDLLIPLALAALVTFLLAPLVSRIERWVGRIGAVMLVVAVILSAAGLGGWVLTRQLVDLANKLPDYKENIQLKLRFLKVGASGRFRKIQDTVDELKRDLPGAGTPETNGDASRPVGVGKGEPTVPSTVHVRMVEEPRSHSMDLIQGIVAPMVGPLGSAALVLLLVILMLLNREDLRSRLIRLIGQGRISATTRAMDDAGARVVRYLQMQLLLNISYGFVVAVGLYFIGVPNAILWGASAAVFRFIPYVGPWIGATMPVALSLAVAPGWMMPILTVGFFVLIELLSNNLFEPLLYGSSTGVSPIALILAAIGWAWLWGPVGLVLATPMTVCLVVMGRHIPRLSFLSVVLSDESALTPAEDCYYRLLTVGAQDEIELVEGFLKNHSLTELYDSVLIPVITAFETDHRLDLLDDGQRLLVEQGLRDLVEDLGAPGFTGRGMGAAVTENGSPVPAAPPAGAVRVFCLPARAERDELAGTMLVQLLRSEGAEARSGAAGLGVIELLSLVEKAAADVVCISVVAPSTVLHARNLCLRLRSMTPQPRIVVGLWGGTENVGDATRRVRASGADDVVTTLAEAVALLCPKATASPSAPVVRNAVEKGVF